MKNLKLILLISLLLIPFLMQSQQIVYRPINPAFGGYNSYNYNWLLSSAEAQSKFTEDNDYGFETQSELEIFTETLNRQLLNSLSQDLFFQEFGDSPLTEGAYVFGSLIVDVTPTAKGLSVNILDTKSGDQTQIIIPNN